MAYLKIEHFSDCLRRNVSFRVLLPNDVNGDGNPHYDRPMKTLYLLHGYCGMSSDWIWNSAVADISNRYHLCIVLPDGENSFYLDGDATGRKYATFIGEELPAYISRTFHLSAKKEDVFTGGFSMGGFGAIHNALRYPETFGKLFAFSSAMIVHEVGKMEIGEDNGVANYAYYKLMFGEPKELLSSENNPEELLRRLLTEGKSIPGIYMACGTEDFLLQKNRSFHEFLQTHGITHEYIESNGCHNFEFWNRYLEPAVKWLLDVE